MDFVNTNWQIISFKVEKENQIIPINFKLPNEVNTCNGIYISVKERLDTKDNFISQVGEISLSFNAKQLHLLHFTADYNKDLSNKKKSLKLDCEIHSNKNISGFYIDYAKLTDNTDSFLPYSISIYLECSTKKPIKE